MLPPLRGWNMPRLSFHTDSERDLGILRGKNLPQMFEEMLEFCIECYYPTVQPPDLEHLTRHIESNLHEVERELRETGSLLEKAWDAVGENFFSQVEEITGFSWRYPEYRCHLSFAWIGGGGYDPDANTVTVCPRVTHCEPLYVLLHELTHLHYWETLDRMGIRYDMKEKLASGWSLWDLSEVAVHYPLERLTLPGFTAPVRPYQ